MGEDDCIFKEQPWYSYGLGLVLIFGVILSYIPQHFAIINSKSARGISWITIALANLSTCCNTLNAVLEQWHQISCCDKFSALQCNAVMLPTYHISVGWINSFILFVLVLVYFPLRDFPPQLMREQENEIYKRNCRSRMLAIWSFVAYLVLNLVAATAIGLAMLLVYGTDSKPLKTYAFSLGIVATCATVVQWTPQIWKTWNAKDIGNLSILMLLLQTPGSFLVVLFQGILNHQNISTWMPFFLTGIQQAVLLAICIYLEVRRRLVKRRETPGQLTENTPLINELE